MCEIVRRAKMGGLKTHLRLQEREAINGLLGRGRAVPQQSPHRADDDRPRMSRTSRYILERASAKSYRARKKGAHDITQIV